ncbi:hypothetical protein RLIN73S_05252 [Rhodanobacter lindaniclasticus]
MPSASVSPCGSRLPVTNQNAIADSSAEMITPLYSAPMIEPPVFTRTKKVAMIEATIDTAPSISGYSSACRLSVKVRPASSMVAITVTA